MNKQYLIEEITKHNAKVIWEIDNSKFYGVINFDGVDTEWLKSELEKRSIDFLNNILNSIQELVTF